MDVEWLRKICLSLPGTTEQVQWGNDLLFKVHGKMFSNHALGAGTGLPRIQVLR